MLKSDVPTVAENIEELVEEFLLMELESDYDENPMIDIILQVTVFSTLPKSLQLHI